MHRSITQFIAAATLVALASTASAQTIAAKRGTQVEAKLDQTLDTKKLHDGDTFTLHEYDSWFHRNPSLNGLVIDGHVENVVAAGPTHKASMNVIFDDMHFADGSPQPAKFSIKSMKALEPKTHHVRDLGIIVGSAVTGHIVSKKTGHGGGTFAGAAAGFAIAQSLKSDIRLKSGSVIDLYTTGDITR